MSKKAQSNHQASTAGQARWLWFVAAGALLLIVGGAILWWNATGTDASVTGTPRLTVDQTTIDDGYVKYNTPLQATFKLNNTGNQPLKILGEPKVELIEGC